RLPAGDYIVHIRGVTPAVDGLALLGQRRLLVEIVGAVQFVHIARNDHPFGILPGTPPDPIPGVDGGLTAGRTRAQVGVPRPVTGADRLRPRLAALVCTRHATQLRYI